MKKIVIAFFATIYVLCFLSFYGYSADPGDGYYHLYSEESFYSEKLVLKIIKAEVYDPQNWNNALCERYRDKFIRAFAGRVLFPIWREQRMGKYVEFLLDNFFLQKIIGSLENCFGKDVVAEHFSEDSEDYGRDELEDTIRMVTLKYLIACYCHWYDKSFQIDRKVKKAMLSVLHYSLVSCNSPIRPGIHCKFSTTMSLGSIYDDTKLYSVYDLQVLLESIRDRLQAKTLSDDDKFEIYRDFVCSTGEMRKELTDRRALVDSTTDRKIESILFDCGIKIRAEQDWVLAPDVRISREEIPFYKMCMEDIDYFFDAVRKLELEAAELLGF